MSVASRAGGARLATMLALSACLGAAPGTAAPLVGLDHVVVVVRDLDAAAGRWRKLGFTLKPGRPHANGIRNWHVKFEEGTEIELLTAPEARDALTREYRDHLAEGDGPRFLALYAPDPAAVGNALAEPGTPRGGGAPRFPLGHPLHGFFFGSRNASPTDRPEHFVHANGARSLAAVWLAGDDLDSERRWLARLGAPAVADTSMPPDWRPAARCAVIGGEVRLLGPGAVVKAGRRVCGVTVRVPDLDAARRATAGVPGVRGLARGGATSLIVPPASAHGLWLEFLAAETGGASGR